MKQIMLILAFVGALSAAPCSTSQVGNVSLTSCKTGDGDLHFFVSTTDDRTIAFRLAVRTDAGGEYTVVDNEYGTGAIHVKSKLKGKLQHVTVTELHEFNRSAFSALDGTLP